MIWILILLSIRSISGQATIEFQKCCPDHQVFEASSLTCIKPKFQANETLIRPITKKTNGFNVHELSMSKQNVGLPKCLQNETLLLSKTRTLEYTLIVNNELQELGLLRKCPRKVIHKGQEKYCFDLDTDLNTIAITCGIPKTCIKTCCPHGQYLGKRGNVTKCLAMVNPQNWTIEFDDNSDVEYELFHLLPCPAPMPQSEKEGHEWYFKSNGELVLDMTPYPPDRYCLNYAEDFTNKSYTKEIYICDSEGDKCRGPLRSWFCMIDLTLVPILMGLSLVFLIGLLFVIWFEKKDKLYDCMMFCNVCMLSLLYTTLIILKTNKFSGGICQFLGLLYHYSYMSAFFWLSAMSHFIWKSFKGIRLKSFYKPKYGFTHRKFKYYAFYAFGCPALVSIVTIVLHHLPEKWQNKVIAPRLGEDTCALGEPGEGFDIPKLWYFHLINIFVLIAILGFFCIFSWNMLAGFWSTNIHVADDKERIKKRNQRLKVVLKMFFVMGITWTTEIIMWAIETKYTKYQVFKNTGLRYAGLVFQIINSSQGVIMFTVMFFDANRIDTIKAMFTKSIETENGSVENRKPSESLTGSGATNSTNLSKSPRKISPRTVQPQTGKLLELSTINEEEISSTSADIVKNEK